MQQRCDKKSFMYQSLVGNIRINDILKLKKNMAVSKSKISISVFSKIKISPSVKFPRKLSFSDQIKNLEMGMQIKFDSKMKILGILISKRNFGNAFLIGK